MVCGRILYMFAGIVLILVSDDAHLSLLVVVYRGVGGAGKRSFRPRSRGSLLRCYEAPPWQFRSPDAAGPPESVLFIQGPCSRKWNALNSP